MFRLIICFFLILLFSDAALTQKGGIGREIRNQEPNFELFMLPGGEAGNKVQQIVQDATGFLWFGSEGGLHRYDGHRFRTFKNDPTDSNSVSQSYIECLLVDSENRLWVGTRHMGLNLFDPNTEQFIRIPETLSDSVANSAWPCKALVEDQYGNIWAGTEDGLRRIDRNTFAMEAFLQGWPKDYNSVALNVMEIHEDREGYLWIGTWGNGLIRFDPKTNTLKKFLEKPADQNSFSANVVLSIVDDPNGDLLIGGSDGTIKHFNLESNIFFDFPKNERQAGLLSFPLKDTSANLPAVSSILQDQSDYIWFGAFEEGIKRFDIQSGQIDHYLDGKSGLLNNSIWNMFESRDGVIWIATGAEGQVFKVSPNERVFDLQEGQFVFEEFKKTSHYRALGNGHPDDRWLGPLSLTFDPDNGSMWLKYVYEPLLGGDYVSYAILANYDKHSSKTVFFHLQELNLQQLNTAPYIGNGNPDWSATGMAIDKAGKIWGTYPTESVGIFCFDPISQQTQHYQYDPKQPDGLPSNYIVRMIMDRHGNLWTAHMEMGLSKFNPSTEVFTHYGAEKEPPFRLGGNFPIALLEGLDGKIWTGGLTTVLGTPPFLTSIDVESNVTQDYSFPNQYLQTNIRFLAQQDDAIIIASNETGLGVLYPDKPDVPIFFYNPDDTNFPISEVAIMVSDQRGKIWAGSLYDGNLACMELSNEQWILFKNANNVAAFKRRGMLGPDGHIYFLNHNVGWTEIDPNKFSLLQVDSSSLILTDLYRHGERQIPGNNKLLSKPIWELDQLNLSYDTKSFTFQFSYLHFQSPNAVYWYRLVPYETNWKKIVGNPEVNYSNIPVGSYNFEVKAYGADGLSSKKIALEVNILPPWWKAWWAFFLYSLVGLLLLTGFFLYQRRRWQLQTTLQLEQERADRLKELDHFKSRFYTNITHEFRTPLTVIKGISNQIDGQEKIKTLIQRNSTRLLNLVNQLLDLSKLETNSLKVDWVKGDIIPYLQYLTESCHSLAGTKNINLAFFSKEESLEMDFDENKLQQILINLLSNAIKFTPEYGSVKVIAAQVIENGDPILELTVQDTGKGIPKEKIANIFNRFYQVDDSATRQGEGSGIGLALIKELVHLLEGRIKVKSEVGKGSSFLVYLPIHLEAQKDLGAPSTHSEPLIEEAERGDHAIPTPAVANGEKSLVLIIEDNADVTEYIISCLSPNYNLQTARNGQEGLEKALEIIPDVILSDVMMPEMDGFEVCRRLKTDRRSSHIPIVLLTAKATQEDKVTGLSHGADAYLTKPFDKEELLVRLNNLAALSQRLRERLSTIVPTTESVSEVEDQEATFLKEVNEIIESKLGDELFDTNHLCLAIAMSRTQLHRKLKALTGQSTASFIRTIRLKKAKVLLENTDLPIGDIASQIGYKDFSHFSRSFLKEFGVQPSETRK